MSHPELTTPGLQFPFLPHCRLKKRVLWTPVENAELSLLRRVKIIYTKLISKLHRLLLLEIWATILIASPQLWLTIALQYNYWWVSLLWILTNSPVKVNPVTAVVELLSMEELSRRAWESCWREGCRMLWSGCWKLLPPYAGGRSSSSSAFCPLSVSKGGKGDLPSLIDLLISAARQTAYLLKLEKSFTFFSLDNCHVQYMDSSNISLLFFKEVLFNWAKMIQYPVE